MFYPRIQLLLDQGRFSEAEAAIREELSSSMEEPMLFYLLSIALLSQNKPKEAESAARESIALEPSFDLGFFMLSRCLLERGNKQESLIAIKEAIQLDPDDADYFSQKAQIYLSWNKYRKSLEAAETGLGIFPEHDGCRYFRSIALERLGRKEEADEESLALLSDDPEDYQNHCVRGWVLAQRGETEQAERHFVEALRIFPDGEDAREGLAHTYRLRSPVLGSLLRLLIMLGRIPWWIFLIGIWITMGFADELAKSDLAPPLPQIGAGIRILFYTFFIIAMLMQPLFNLLLLKSKTARHALSNDERSAVKWFIMPLIISMLYLGYWCIFSGGRSFPIHAVSWAALARFTFEIFEADNLWVRRWMTVLTVLVLGGVLCVEYVAYWHVGPRKDALVAEYRDSIQMVAWEAEEVGDENRERCEEFFQKLNSLYRFKLKYTYYLAIVLWLLACFSDDIANFLRRRAPD